MNNIFTIFLGALSFSYHYRNCLFKALIAPLVILSLLAMAEHTLELTNFWSIPLKVIDSLTYTVFAITIHRIVLLGEGSVPEWGLRKISMREMSFFIRSIGIGLLLIAPGLLIFVPYLGWILALVSIAYLLGRLSLVFPALATGQEWTFKDSWTATKEHQFMMAVVAAVIPLIVALPVIALAFIPNTEVFSVILSLLTTIFGIVALSLAFKLVQDENQAR